MSPSDISLLDELPILQAELDSAPEELLRKLLEPSGSR